MVYSNHALYVDQSISLAVIRMFVYIHVSVSHVCNCEYVFLAKVSVTELNQWTSYLKYDSGTQTEYFLHSNPVTVILYCNTTILVYACSPTVLPQYTQD